MNKKVYFASDFHLGADAYLKSKKREKVIVKWLNEIHDDMEELYLVGDIFDFWFEYRYAIPKGFTRFLGKLAELRDDNIPIHMFTGNHDMWMFDYFKEEFDIDIIKGPVQKVIQGKQFLIGHGDGLGPKDVGYKLMKKVMSHRLSKWAYARLHPNFGLRLMRKFSHTSRESGDTDAKFYGREKEMLVQYAERKSAENEYDYFIFGHRHLPLNVLLSNGHSRYFCLGDWTYYQSYGVLDNGNFELKFYDRPNELMIIE